MNVAGRWALLALLGRLLFACTTSPSPATAQTVYDRLVEAGCLTSSPDGVQAVSDEHADSEQPAWMACMFRGGTVAACGVPCQ